MSKVKLFISGDVESVNGAGKCFKSLMSKVKQETAKTLTKVEARFKSLMSKVKQKI